MADTNQVQTSVNAFLTSKHLPPNQQWLRNFTPSIRLTTPIVALQQTALFRLLASDLTVSLQAQPQGCFPTNLGDPGSLEQKLRGPIAVQVLDVEDVGRSRWSQVEAIEMEERGETTKGREVIRVVPEAENGAEPAVEAKGGPHKLLLQDAKGNKVYGFELEAIEGVGVGMAIGRKLVLRDLVVARGVVLLEPRGVEVLGGKVDAWDKKWREERKRVLKEKAGWTEGVGG